MKILLVGGGTGGPVMPLIAVAQKIKQTHAHAQFLFIGTSGGPEKDIAAKYKIPFESVPAGKLRRYFSLANLAAPFQVCAGFVKALLIIKKFQPDVVFAAGGYVAVPVVLAARIAGKKTIIHQQDYLPSLTNKILAPFATKITVTFEHSVKDFRSGSGFFGFSKKEHKIVWTGNPFREELSRQFGQKDLQKAREHFGLSADLPVILILGGATGAVALNRILEQALPKLVNIAQVIHSTGANKSIKFEHENYHAYEMIPNMDEAYAVSEIVVSRAGLSTITELSALRKVAIIVPMPATHQVDNAGVLMIERAAIVASQRMLDAESLISIIRKVMYDGEWQNLLKENIYKLMPHNATEKIAKIIIDLCQ